MSERKMNPPIPGHKLLMEGDKWPEVGPDEEYTGRYVGGCQCGAQPDDFPNDSISATKRWHREHKAELRTQRVAHTEGKWPSRKKAT